MKRFLTGFFAVIGVLAFAFVLLIFLVATSMRSVKAKVASNTILELNLETPVLEDTPDDPFARLSSQETPVLRDIVEGLEKASADSHVSGLIARLGGGTMSLAQAQEVRDAIQAFRAKKKFAVVYSETFGEFGPGTGSYYLATAFDEIWLQPSGDIGLIGVTMESMFLKGVFEKLGIIPRMDHRWEYKNAMNQYTEKKFTAPHKEAMAKVKDSWFNQMVKGIAAGRKLNEDKVRELVDKGPFLGKEAQDAGLVDGLAYRDEVYAKVKAKAGKDARLLFLKQYLARAGRPHEKGKVIALIHGIGGVARGKSRFDAVEGSGTMGSDTVAAAFRSATEDKDVRAILFRVDSPGGSYVASDAIWRETVRAKKAGKPVIVSMSTLAGSGGYFVAMAADKIVAQPGTITGSIGVLGGKMLTNGLWDKLGLSWDEVHSGSNALMFNGTHDYSKEEWARFQAWLDRVYSDFTSKVADGRHLPKEKVLEIAKGRIWTGEDAKAIGLVDVLGGYPAAIKLAREAGKIGPDEDIELRIYPKKRTTYELLMAKLQGEEQESSESKVAEAGMQILESIRPIAKALRAATSGAAENVLAMPEVRLAQ